tara:strand:- start:458 stop:787 length:330 start_codon:yes stop_codon:yes gene_type:complete
METRAELDEKVLLEETKDRATGIRFVVAGLELRITTDFAVTDLLTRIGVKIGVLTMVLVFLVCRTDTFGCKTGIILGVTLATLISFKTGSFRIVSFLTGGGAFLFTNSI